MSTASASVEVPCDPDTAFGIFTAGPGLSEGYRHGWAELLGFYARTAEAR
jgi:hypothetical protein